MISGIMELIAPQPIGECNILGIYSQPNIFAHSLTDKNEIIFIKILLLDMNFIILALGCKNSHTTAVTGSHAAYVYFQSDNTWIGIC